MQVYVLLFNARTDNEGIHTLSVDGQNVVFMFEDEDDAARYGLMLEAQDLPSPTVEGFDAAEIEDFCRDVGYDCKLVPSGTLEIPPERTIGDWDPDAKPGEGRRSSDSDLSNATSDSTSDSDSSVGMATEELDRIRRQLEGLL